MLEAFLGFLIEFLLQVFGEAIFSIALHTLAEPFRKMPVPWIAGIGYAIFGTVLAGVSLFLFPSYFIAEPALRLVNLAVTPLLVGLLSAGVGELRARRGKAVLRIDRFVYGYLFALAFGSFRFLWAAS